MHALRLRRLRAVRGRASPRATADINRCPPGGDAVVVALAALTGRARASRSTPAAATHGPLLLAVIDEAACIGCTLCIEACPGRRDHRRAKAHARDPAVAVLRLRAVRGALPRRLHRDGRRRNASGPRPTRTRRAFATARATRASTSASASPIARRTRWRTSRPSAKGGRPRSRRRWRAPARGAVPDRSTMPHRSSLRACVLRAVRHLPPLHAARHGRRADHRFSAQLDTLWNYDKPADSEARFRAELAQHRRRLARSARSRHADRAHAMLAAQVRRGRRTLDAVLPSSTPRRRVYACATCSSAGARATRAATRRPRSRCSTKRSQLSARDALPGADFYRVDALHMLGIAAPAAEQLDWNLQALAAAEASSDRATRGWARIALQQHRLDLLRARRSGDRARLLEEGAAAARSVRQQGDDPRREMDGRARLSRASASSTTRRRMQLALAAETERGQRARRLRLRGARGDRARARRTAQRRGAVGGEGARAAQGRRLPQGERGGAPCAARADRRKARRK